MHLSNEADDFVEPLKNSPSAMRPFLPPITFVNETELIEYAIALVLENHF
jgi:hypothetical protein